MTATPTAATPPPAPPSSTPSLLFISAVLPTDDIKPAPRLAHSISQHSPRPITKDRQEKKVIL